VSPATRFDPEAEERLAADAAEIVARYPRPRSALLPLLHLVQAHEGYVSPAGIEFCARQLELTPAQVSAVATFYTMYKRHPVGDYHVGVCTNTLCAVMGGDAVFAALQEHLGVGHDETTDDGVVTLEHLECNAACDYAPVVMVNWEFFDNQTPSSARELVDALRAGQPPRPTRGAPLRTFRETARVLAGFYDGRADEGVAAGPASLAGLELSREHGWDAAVGPPDEPSRPTPAEPAVQAQTGRRSESSAADEGVSTAESDPAHPSRPAKGQP
jgi:NADH-quinone oxidoreductase subunit E